MLTNTSTHQNDMSHTTVDAQDGDDGVSELGVSDAEGASGPGTIDAASTATNEESQSYNSHLPVRKVIKTVWDFEKLERSGQNNIKNKVINEAKLLCNMGDSGGMTLLMIRCSLPILMR